MFTSRVLGAVSALTSFTAVVAGAVFPSAQLPLSSRPGTQKTVISEEFYNRIAFLLKNNTVPGYSVALVKLGQEDEFEFASWGNRTEDGDKVTPETLFTLASVTKAFTATAVGILIDDFALGRNSTPLPEGLQEFTWTTKVKDLLPDLWELMDPWASNKANVKDILSHCTGLPRQTGDSPVDLISRLRYLRPAYELREKYHYNNLMYVTASHLVARYSGLPYPTFMTNRIFTPLNMTGTTYWPSNASASGHFSQSWTGSDRRIPPAYTDTTVPLHSGPGGVISSAADMAKWARFVLNVAVGKEDDENTGIPISAVREAITPHTFAPWEQKGYGLSAYGHGWGVTTYQGHKMLDHDGGTLGVSTAVTLFPEDKFGIVQLANAHQKGRVHSEVMWQIAEAALGIPLVTDFDHEAHLTDSPATAPKEATNSSDDNLELYAGTYADAGYGSFTLCAPTSTSHYCDSVTSIFHAVNSSYLDKPVLLGRWPRTWGEYVRAVRASGDHRFALSLGFLYPEGYGRDKTPFESSLISGEDSHGPFIQFVVEKGKAVGFGLFGTIKEETERLRLGKTVEERAEAWFRHV